MNLANSGYEDEILSLRSHYSPETGEILPDPSGDGLSRFIAVELAETFDPNASREDQLDEARRVMESAAEQIQNVLTVLENA